MHIFIPKKPKNPFNFTAFVPHVTQQNLLLKTKEKTSSKDSLFLQRQEGCNTRIRYEYFVVDKMLGHCKILSVAVSYVCYIPRDSR
ncbi:hypothetical protein Ahy_A06g026585 isoform E [Arachis hypogaea]|uniref:Uncharacterized protein n=1 Tax=Arachis hypogaea TaxID=3818 RepID=A0A445CKZ2_ARAHY|nr:hypothetical protein Ahy_A06g026585 isoform E [Arachis hypogaea]